MSFPDVLTGGDKSHSRYGIFLRTSCGSSKHKFISAAEDSLVAILFCERVHDVTRGLRTRLAQHGTFTRPGICGKTLLLAEESEYEGASLLSSSLGEELSEFIEPANTSR